MKTKVSLPYVLMAILAVAGMVITYLSTPWGVLVDSDSYFYLTAAQNFISGAGLGRLSQAGQLIPLTHYPPLYPLLVAGFSIFTAGNVLLAARILACLLFGGNSFLFGWLLARYTHAPWAGLGGTIVFLVSSVTLSVIVAGLSEGIFLLLLMLALLCITEYQPLKGKAWLAGASVATALACLSRYVGEVVVLAGLAGLLLHKNFPWKERLKTALIYGTATLVPMLIWYLRDWLLTGSTTNRTLVFHWPGRPALYEAIATAAGWFLPGKVTLDNAEAFLLVTGLIGVIALGAWLLSARSRTLENTEEKTLRFAGVLIVFIVSYCLSLLISRTFLDASTHWDTRILSPLYVTTELLFACVAWYATWANRAVWGKLIVTGLGLYLVWMNLPLSVAYLRNYAQAGYGYTNKAMQTSLAIAHIKSTQTGYIFSNNAAAIYFNTGKLADWIPEKYDSVKGLPRDDFQQNLALMQAEMQVPGSLLVIFKPYLELIEYPPLSELTQGLVILKNYKDATLYVAPDR